MVTNKNEVKTMAKHMSWDCKCKFSSTTCNSNEKRVMQFNLNVNAKIIISAKKIMVGILAYVFVRIVSI